MKSFEFNHLGKTYKGHIEKATYPNGRLAVVLHDEESGYAKLSINVPEYKNIAEGEFVFKNYSENEGLYEEMLRLGVIKPTGKYASSGYVSCPICTLCE